MKIRDLTAAATFAAMRSYERTTKKLLAEIEGGKTVFNAKGNTEAELSAFEVVVSDLQAIATAGLIVIKTLHQETGSGGRYVDHVKVSVS